MNSRQKNYRQNSGVAGGRVEEESEGGIEGTTQLHRHRGVTEIG